jgi:hypothetical protein
VHLRDSLGHNFLLGPKMLDKLHIFKLWFVSVVADKPCDRVEDPLLTAHQNFDQSNSWLHYELLQFAKTVLVRVKILFSQGKFLGFDFCANNFESISFLLLGSKSIVNCKIISFYQTFKAKKLLLVNEQLVNRVFYHNVILLLRVFLDFIIF